ncbi:MAG: hypothetical protein RIS75_772 [Actinomycetota bacterium]|jgi:Xaa-Pro aminopeptidase
MQPESHRARAQHLREAETAARQLFSMVQAQEILVPGTSELDANSAIREIAKREFGVDKFWHKRIVRSGPNTMFPYRENPPDRVMTVDDIVFLDFGPIFADWEADFGRTFVIGNDPHKLQIQHDCETLWSIGKEYFETHLEITGEEIYEFLKGQAKDRGYTFGDRHCGHLIGDFPHEKIENDKITSYLTSGNTLPLRRFDELGRPWHWILEIHIVDESRQYGAFFEQLLTVD